MHKASQQTMISHKPVGSGRIYSAWQTGSCHNIAAAKRTAENKLHKQ